MYDNYSTYETSTADPGASMAVFSTVIIISLIVALILYVIHAFLLSKIFKKAGVDGWIAWVPIYNSWRMLEIGGQPGWWAILSLIPVVNYVAMVFLIIAMYRIGLNLQKEGWFVILAIIVPTVWLAWLAFDSSTWKDAQQDSQNPSNDPPVQPAQPLV